jgi:putative phage-type endonuclease
MTKEEREIWKRERRTYLGGSELADIVLASVGLKGYATPYSIWAQKMGLAEIEDLSDNRHIEWGNRLEDSIAQWYGDKTGRKVMRVEETFRHPEYPFLGANIDRRIVDIPAGLECKNVDRFSAIGKDGEERWGKEEGGDKVPYRHFIQCMAYLSITRLEFWDLAALIGGNDPRIYTIKPDAAIIQSILKIGVDFWKLVKTKTAPPAFDIADAKRKFPTHITGDIIEADAHIFERVEQYRKLKEEAKTYGERAEQLQAEIADFMGPSETMTYNGEPIVTWKTQENKGYVVQPYSSRVMRLKAVKK